MPELDERRNSNLWDALFRMRDEQRERAAKGLLVVRGRDIPWEQNRQGRMQWYLHPALRDTVIRNLIFYRQEIAPGGRSGRVRSTGNEVLLILQGRGYTEIDGVKHFWKAGDVVGLPIRERGIVVQHFNLDPEEPARFVAASPNFTDPLGVDGGSGFEQLEDAPE